MLGGGGGVRICVHVCLCTWVCVWVGVHVCMWCGCVYVGIVLAYVTGSI